MDRSVDRYVDEWVVGWLGKELSLTIWILFNFYFLTFIYIPVSTCVFLWPSMDTHRAGNLKVHAPSW